MDEQAAPPAERFADLKALRDEIRDELKPLAGGEPLRYPVIQTISVPLPGLRPGRTVTLSVPAGLSPDEWGLFLEVAGPWLARQFRLGNLGGTE